MKSLGGTRERGGAARGGGARAGTPRPEGEGPGCSAGGFGPRPRARGSAGRGGGGGSGGRGGNLGLPPAGAGAVGRGRRRGLPVRRLLRGARRGGGSAGFGDRSGGALPGGDPASLQAGRQPRRDPAAVPQVAELLPAPRLPAQRGLRGRAGCAGGERGGGERERGASAPRGSAEGAAPPPRALRGPAPAAGGSAPRHIPAQPGRERCGGPARTDGPAGSVCGSFAGSENVLNGIAQKNSFGCSEGAVTGVKPRVGSLSSELLVEDTGLLFYCSPTRASSESNYFLDEIFK